MATRIRFNVRSSRAHLATLRDTTTRRGRKAMNRWLFRLFVRAGVPMDGVAKREAQALYVGRGRERAKRYVLSLSR